MSQVVPMGHSYLDHVFRQSNSNDAKSFIIARLSKRTIEICLGVLMGSLPLNPILLLVNKTLKCGRYGRHLIC